MSIITPLYDITSHTVKSPYFCIKFSDSLHLITQNIRHQSHRPPPKKWLSPKQIFPLSYAPPPALHHNSPTSFLRSHPSNILISNPHLFSTFLHRRVRPRATRVSQPFIPQHFKSPLGLPERAHTRHRSSQAPNNLPHLGLRSSLWLHCSSRRDNTLVQKSRKTKNVRNHNWWSGVQVSRHNATYVPQGTLPSRWGSGSTF